MPIMSVQFSDDEDENTHRRQFIEIVNGIRTLHVTSQYSDKTYKFAEQELPFNEEFPGTPKTITTIIPQTNLNNYLPDTKVVATISVNEMFAFVPSVERNIIATYFTRIVPIFEHAGITSVLIPNINGADTNYAENNLDSDMSKLGIVKNNIFVIRPNSLNGKHAWVDDDTSFINYSIRGDINHSELIDNCLHDIFDSADIETT